MNENVENELLKMADLARRSGVPAPTIKHYIREGLLPPPAKRTSKNMAYYDAGIIPRIQAIKELQRTRFLPLRVIKELLDGAEPGAGPSAEAAITRVLQDMAPSRYKTRQQLVDEGMPGAELDWFQELGLVSPSFDGGQEQYVGDDLVLVETLNAARQSGITREMLPPTILEPYIQSIRELVRLEIRMFSEGVVPRAGDDLPVLAEAATVLSEKLVVLLRRKMLVPTLREMLVGAPPPPAAKAARKRSSGRASAERKAVAKPASKGKRRA